MLLTEFPEFCAPSLWYSGTAAEDECGCGGSGGGRCCGGDWYVGGCEFATCAGACAYTGGSLPNARAIKLMNSVMFFMSGLLLH